MRAHTQDGYVFRLTIHHHQELSLLKDQVTTATDPRTQKALQQRLKRLERRLVALPVHTSTLLGYVPAL